jgi:serine protease AprX
MTLRVRRLLGLAATSLATGVLVVTSATVASDAGIAWTAGRAPAVPLQSVIVQARAGQAGALAAAVRAAGGHVDRQLPIVNGFAARVSATQLAALHRSRSVRAVTANADLTSASSSYDPSVPGASYAGSVRATTAWAAGDTGAGIGVAVLDTGVQPVADLAGHLTAGIDLSGDGNSLQDSYGHGTVIAGLIAGSGVSSGGLYPGIAPGAKITSVKVAGANGVTDVSQVLAGLQWIGTFGPARGIRVVALAWGTPSHQSTLVDPLDFAVERLWGMGITVVTSAGNSGPGAGTITKPGDDPAVITVGAYDDLTTQDNSDDALLPFSSRGPTANGAAKPDVLAPGRSLVSLRSPGSTIEKANPQALVGDSYIRGSGTSQATAVTAGGVALLLFKHPTWTPDKIKYALTSTAHPISGAVPADEGAGEVRLNRALYANVGSAPTQVLSATGMGSLEASRGGNNVWVLCPGDSAPSEVTGEVDAQCQPWDAESWSAESWSAESWSAESWSAESWSAESWSAESWSAESWSAESWSAESWSSASWDPEPASGGS